MAHELWRINVSQAIDITPIVGSISWSDDVDTLGQQLTFNTAYNDTRYFPQVSIEPGDTILLKNKNEIFRGTMVTEQRNGQFERVFTCFDPAFYLNKSKEIFQCNKVRADVAIKQLCNMFNVPIGNVVSIPAVIKKIFNGEISAIIKEILEIAENTLGIKYRFEMRSGKLFIEKQTALIVKGTFTLAGIEYDLNESISNPSRKRSIEEMKNSIKIINNDKVVTTVRDEGLISKYGLLQEVHSVNDDEKSKAKNIANNILKELGKVLEENSLDMLGNDEVRAGRLIEINEPKTGMSGRCLIKSVNHTLDKGIHRMSLQLRVI
ncbi:XkdQ/YqbQ family protein [Bacillus sp. JJ1474]|uniref:XkdQ/YqbQ family protein n=1 Tax=Bacillus sp. JJ1474 TaxID=3122955 RepID=UPI002FFDC657